MTTSTAVALPFDPANMAVALKKASREAGGPSSFLKMEKTGSWVFGIAGTEVSEEDEFIVNPGGFQHGFVAWGDSSNKLAEIMSPINVPTEDPGPAPEDAEGGWQVQMGMSLVKADTGEPMIYRATSVGGKRAIAELGGQIADKLVDGDPKCVPVVTLSSESYKHAKYGKIFNPLISVVRWVPMPKEGDTPKKVAAAPAAKKAAAKAKK